MSFRAGLHGFLRDGTDVAVFPLRLPVEPPDRSIVYRLVGDFSEHVHSGPSGLIEQRIQLDIYAPDHDALDSLAGAVRRLMDGYRGPWGDVTIGHCLIANDFDSDEVNTRLWRRIQDYLVAYNVAVGS